MGESPITFLWLWPATDHEPHCRHVPIEKIRRQTKSTPRSGHGYDIVYDYRQSHGWNLQRMQHSHIIWLVDHHCRQVDFIFGDLSSWWVDSLTLSVSVNWQVGDLEGRQDIHETGQTAEKVIVVTNTVKSNQIYYFFANTVSKNITRRLLCTNYCAKYGLNPPSKNVDIFVHPKHSVDCLISFSACVSICLLTYQLSKDYIHNSLSIFIKFCAQLRNVVVSTPIACETNPK